MSSIIEQRAANEKAAIESLTDFQKEVIASLKSLEYEHLHFTNFKHPDSKVPPVNVSEIKDLSDLFAKGFSSGRLNKQWEIKDVLGIS